MTDRPTPIVPDRTYRLTGTYNFRDIGGYRSRDGRRVRWGQVFRSDAMHRLTQDDVERLRPLGVRTILDLRSHREIADAGPGLIHDEPGIDVVHIPFGRIGEEADPKWQLLTLSDLYHGIVTDARSALAQVMTTLATADAVPAVVHCAAGKDRTGVSIALLLRLLGVDDGTIIDDYVLTEQNFVAFKANLSPEALHHLSNIPDELLRVDAMVLVAALAFIDAEYGTTENYLLDAGVGPDTVATLRDRLLD